MGKRRVVILRGLIDEVAVALDEGAAHRVLAREPDRKALIEQGREGQVLGRGPVDVLARLDGGVTMFDHPADGSVDVESGRNTGEIQAEVAQLLQGGGG